MTTYSFGGGLDWGVIAGVLSSGVALAAVTVALGSLRQAQRQHRENLRAIVRPAFNLTDFDPHGGDGLGCNLVNIGLGPALQGQIEIWIGHNMDNVDPSAHVLRSIREGLEGRIRVGGFPPRFVQEFAGIGSKEALWLILEYPNGRYVGFDHPGWVHWRVTCRDIHGHPVEAQEGGSPFQLG